MPARPQSAAGPRIEPPVSLPVPAAMIPAATAAPVLVVPLPGKSRRQGLFLDMMLKERRVRMFDGRYAPWPVTPLNDTPLAAAEMRRRLGL
jgi:mitochondrial fission protein ELM1